MKRENAKIAFVTTVPITQWAFLRGQNAYMRERGFELHAISSPGPDLDRLVHRDHACSGWYEMRCPDPCTTCNKER
jgi:hypothetical protein